MRRFSRWLLRRRRAMRLEELEEGIRKQDACHCPQTRTSCRWHRRRVETPSQLEWTKGRSCSARIHVDLLQTRASGASRTLVKEKRPRLIGKKALADFNRTLKHLRRAPARRSCPPWSRSETHLAASHVTDFLAQKKRNDALRCKPPAGSQLMETQIRHYYNACNLLKGNFASVTSSSLLRIPTSTSEGGSSGFTPGPGSTLSTREHLIG